MTGLFFNHKENIRVIHNNWKDDISILQENLHIRKAGINLGRIMQNELIPHHELALSTIIKNTVQKADLTKEEALQYLRKREIQFQ